jgi:hypothetical protein
MAILASPTPHIGTNANLYHNGRFRWTDAPIKAADVSRFRVG